jgi:hypothetical protein
VIVRLKDAVDLLRRWDRHHERAIRGNPCDSFNACDDIHTETVALVRRVSVQRRDNPMPNCPKCAGPLTLELGQPVIIGPFASLLCKPLLLCEHCGLGFREMPLTLDQIKRRDAVGGVSHPHRNAEIQARRGGSGGGGLRRKRGD